MKTIRTNRRGSPWIIMGIAIIIHCAFFAGSSKAQTSLSSGDLIFTGYNSDGNDSFSIILLKDIAPGTVIRFTDNGWDGTALQTGETEIVYTNTTGRTIYATTQITFVGTTAVYSRSAVSAGTVTGTALSLDSDGDQIFAYQGSSASPSFIAGIHANVELTFVPVTAMVTSVVDWDGSSGTVNKSRLVGTGLTAMNGALFLRDTNILNISISERDNWRLSCGSINISIDILNILSASLLIGNWVFDDGTAYGPCAPICLVTSTLWDGNSWSQGAPSSTLDANIYSTTSPGSFTCQNLMITSGATLAVNSGNTVNVYANLTNSGSGLSGTGKITFNHSGRDTLLGNNISFGGVIGVSSGTTLVTNGKLTITNGGSLLHGSGTVDGGGSVSGVVTISKSINPVDGWRQMALPVQASIDDFEDGLNTFIRTHTPANEINVYWWDASVRGGSTNNVANGWTSALASDNELKGYAIYLANNGIHNFSTTISIQGNVKEGDQVSGLGYTFDTGGDSSTAIQRGWNLIPNPYPSNLDITNLLADANFDPTYKAVHIWDVNVGQYKAINVSGLTNYQTSGGSIFGSKAYIPPFQGFWVKANANSQQVTIKNAHRTGNIDSLTNFLKSDPKKLVLLVTNPQAKTDQLTVCHWPQSSAGFDPTADLLKILTMDNTYPSLYLTDHEGYHYSLNAVPEAENYHFKVRFSAHTSGKHTVKVSDFDFAGDWEIILKDQEGDETLLHQGEHSFQYDGSGTSLLFDLILRKTQLPTDVTKPVAHPERIRAFCHGQNLVVESLDSDIREARVLDWSGREVVTEVDYHQGQCFITGFTPGVYMVRVALLNGNNRTLKFSNLHCTP